MKQKKKCIQKMQMEQQTVKALITDQTAPLGAVRSGSALFAQTSLSQNWGPLRYLENYFLAQNSTDNCHFKAVEWLLID